MAQAGQGTWYLRLRPYDKKTGALCGRFNVGGMLFVAGNWYEIPVGQAKRLLKLKQASGVTYFEAVQTKGEWAALVRSELAASLAGPQAGALAALMTTPTPSVTTPKAPGEVIQSEFDGLTVREVPTNEQIVSAADSLMEATEVPTTKPKTGRRRRGGKTVSTRGRSKKGPSRRSSPKGQ